MYCQFDFYSIIRIEGIDYWRKKNLIKSGYPTPPREKELIIGEKELIFWIIFLGNLTRDI